MGKTIAFTNQKGGVGKTTTCLNLACALHKRGRRILVCDFDPQGNCTSGVGVSKRVSPSIYDVIIRGVPVEDAVVTTRWCDIIPGNKELSGATVELLELEDGVTALQRALDPLKDRYDYIFIDCPPSLEILTLNALTAADSMIVPVQCEYFALEGLADLTTTLKMVNRSYNPRLYIEGIVLTMFDSRTNFSTQVAEEVRKYFGDKVYKTHIPRNVRLAEAPSHGRPGIAYDRMSRGSRAYLHLASEFLAQEV